MSVKFLVVATGYNCEKYVRRCLQSVALQTYKNFRVVIGVDGSTDNTEAEVRQCVKAFTSSFIQSTCISWPVNIGTVAARDRVIEMHGHLYDDQPEVIVWLDLDDALKPNALERVAKEYEDPDCWLTYGNYIDTHGRVFYDESNIDFPSNVHRGNLYRQYDWRFFHLRTFRYKLYKHLAPTDLVVPACQAYPDANMLYCLLELAGRKHIRPIADVLYEYTDTNPISALNRFSSSRRDTELSFVKKITPKKPLTHL